MVQLARSLLSWLVAASGQSTPAGPSVLSCSESGIVIAEEEWDGPLQIGDIFVRVDTATATATATDDDCSILFREILSNEGNGVYKTAPASFSQVFPPETYDHTHKNVPVESILPSGHKQQQYELVMAHHGGLTEAHLARRSLIFGFGGSTIFGFGSGSEPEPAAPEAVATGTEMDGAALAATDASDVERSRGGRHDDYYYDDYYSRSRDDYYRDDRYYDDYYYSDDKGGSNNRCQAVIDATKKLIYDVYCVIRNLDCTPYHPGGRPKHDDYYRDDDYRRRDDDYYHSRDSRSSRSKDKYIATGQRRLQEVQTEQEETTPSSNSDPLLSVEARYVRRTLQDTTVGPRRRSLFFGFGFGGGSEPEPGEPEPAVAATETTEFVDSTATTGMEVTTTVTMGAKASDSHSHSGYSRSSDSKDYYDDHYKDDLYKDDFFDDDYYYDPAQSGRNFWGLLDAVCTYVQSLWKIFGGGDGGKGGGGKNSKSKDYYDDYYRDDRYYDDRYYDDYYRKSKDRYSKDHYAAGTPAGVPEGRGLAQLFDPTRYSMPSWWSRLFVDKPSLQEEHSLLRKVPTSFDEWLTLDGNGLCPFTKCSGMMKDAKECFETQHSVGDTCRDTLDQWSISSPKTTTMSWDNMAMDMACQSQDYCYASNVFGHTTCNEQFYQSLLQVCSASHQSSIVTLSSPTPLVIGDLSENCPLVSILLYSQMRLKSDGLYEAAQETQSVFESAGCRR